MSTPSSFLSFFCCFSVGLFMIGWSVISPAREAELDLESLPLYVGLQYDYDLPQNLKGRKLKFEGTYKRYTALQYNQKAGRIRFNPLRVGLGVLNIKDTAGQILKKLNLRVRKTDLQETAREVHSLLKTVDGISIKILNNRVVVDGEIVIPRDMRRVHSVVREYTGKVTSLVSLSPLAQNKLAKFIEKEINNPKVSVEAKNMTFILRGEVKDKMQKAHAQQIAELYLPDYIVDRAVVESKVKELNRSPILNLIQIRKEEEKPPPKPKLIQLIVHYVELNKDYANNFRFMWQPGIADKSEVGVYMNMSGLSEVSGMISGTVNNLLPKLNWAKTFGFARILHSANVITASNKSATINSIREIPYIATKKSDGTVTTDKARIGLNLKMVPTVTGPRKDSVRLTNVSFSVSNLVGTSGGMPITSTKSLTTNIHVQNGLSAVLGGAINNTSFSDYNRAPPGGSQNPIFSFLSSKKFTRSQSQFVVFVTPLIKSSASSGVNRIKQKFDLSAN